MLLLNGHTSTITALSFSPDGRLLASASKDGTARVWEGGSTIATTHDHRGEVRSIAFSPDGRSLLTGGDDGAIFRTTTEDGRRWHPDALPDVLANSRELAEVTGLYVYNSSPWMTVSATGGVSRAKPGGLRITDWDPTNRMRFDDYDPDGIRAIACLDNPRLIAWATGNLQVGVRELSRPDPIRLPQTHPARALALSPDGASLAVASDWKVKLYDLHSRRVKFTLEGHKGVVSCVAFHPSGGLLISGSWDKSVRLWDPRTGEGRGSFQWPIGRVFAVAFAPDGLRAAAGGDQNCACVWDVDDA